MPPPSTRRAADRQRRAVGRRPPGECSYVGENESLGAGKHHRHEVADEQQLFCGLLPACVPAECCR